MITVSIIIFTSLILLPITAGFALVLWEMWRARDWVWLLMGTPYMVMLIAIYVGVVLAATHIPL